METPKQVSNTGSEKMKRTSYAAPSTEVIKPKNEDFETPTRRNTRSISNNSNRMANATISPDSRNIENRFHAKKTTPDVKSSKRQIELIVLDPSSKKKKLVEKNEPKVGEFYVYPSNRFGASINVLYRYEVITNLKLHMNAQQKELFMASCFGHFLGMSDIRLQNQLIHKLLLLEVRQSSHEEMWFDIAGRATKFSIKEFSLISGLKCDGDDNTSKFKIGACRLKETFFSNLKSVSRKDVERVFLRPPQNTSDEDVVKLGILYLISSFLFTSPQPKLVSKETMNFVDSPQLNIFPWGKELFNITYFSLKMALAKLNPNIGETRGTMSYKLHGFPLAFQIWIYESIPILSGKVCIRVGNSSPRVVNWSSDDTRVTGSSLDKILFDNPEVDVLMLKPSDEEKQAVYYARLEQALIPKKNKSVIADFINDPIHSAKDHNTPGSSNPSYIPSSNQRKRATPKISEQTIISLFEDLLNRVHEIKVQQDQIMDFQVDMQTGILQMQRFNTTRHDMFMEELRTKFPNNPVYDKYARSEHHKTGDMSSSNKSAALGSIETTPNASVRATFTEDGLTENMLSKIGEGCSNLETVSGTVHFQLPTVEEGHEDICFTEDDLNQVDEIVKSANNLKEKRLLQPLDQKNIYLSPERHGTKKVTPDPSGNITNQTYHFKATQTNESDEIPANYRYSIYAFSEGLIAPPPAVAADFVNWIRDGYRPIQIKTKFPASKDTIQPPYKFGPIEVNTKTWWYELWERNVNLRDSLINASYYYFRKMIKYGQKISFNGITTDSFFGSMVRTAYIACKDDFKAISKSRFIVEYVNGEYLHCNRNWKEIEHVLIPIMMEKKAHWILGHFDIKERILHVYNSSRLTIRDRMVIADVEAFAYVLPMLMINMGEWKLSTIAGTGRVEPLVVKIATDIPQDEFGNDSGVFIIKYAEYILNGRLHDMSRLFDPKNARTNLACQLFKYGNEKRCGGYETDLELGPRSVRKARKGKMATIA